MVYVMIPWLNLQSLSIVVSKASSLDQHHGAHSGHFNIPNSSSKTQTVLSISNQTLHPHKFPSQSLKMSINRLPTINLQNILFRSAPNLLPSCRGTHLRTSTKRHHQIHLCFQTDILPLLTRWSFERKGSMVVMNRDIHE